MPTTEPAPEWDWYAAVQLPVGYVHAISGQSRRRKKHPIGFAVPVTEKPAVPKAKRPPARQTVKRSTPRPRARRSGR